MRYGTLQRAMALTRLTKLARSNKKLGGNRIRMEVLEKRVLYSADPVFAPLLEALIHPPEPTFEEQYLLTADTTVPEPLTTELVIVDVSTTDLHALYLSLQDQYAGSTTQVVALNAGEDPFAQLSELLEQYAELDAIHLLSFGSDGQMQLGGESIGSNELLANAAWVESWGDSLADSGDLLLYGCNLSATQAGQQLAQTFSTLMRADVASSNDITGHLDLDGDWDLEIEFGQIETPQLLDQATQDAWVSKLDITTGLIAHYELEVDGRDSAGHGFASSVNNPSFQAGLIDNGLSINDDSLGNPQYLLLDAANAPKYSGGELGVAFWMNPSFIGTMPIVDQSDGVAGYNVQMIATGQIQVEVLQPNGTPIILTSSDAVTSNDWTQVSVTHAAGVWSVYINGVKNSTSVDGSSYSDAGGIMYVGRDEMGQSVYYGMLDDIRFYNKALTADDVDELIILGGGTIVPIPNTEERLPTNAGLSLENGQHLTLTYHELRSADDEQEANEQTFTIDALVPDFTVFLDGVVLGVNDTFTQEDVFNELVSVAHDGIDASAGLMALTLDDGFGTSTSLTFSLAAATNLAPTDIVLLDAENAIDLANATVDENSVDGTVVGKVQGVDPERDALLSQILADTSKIYYSQSAGIFLVVGDGRLDWNDAYDAAADMTLNGVNGFLAMPNNAVEDTLLITAMNDVSLGRTWISATDEDNEGVWVIRQPGEPDVQFSDANGNSVNGVYTNWADAEPNNAFSGENHAEVNHVDGTWNDEVYNKSLGNYFLAEFDVEDVLNGAFGAGTVQRDLNYTIVSQSVNGAFDIDSLTGEIIVANGNLLNHESAQSHNLIIEVIDNAGNVFQRNFTIEVNELDEASTHVVPTTQTVAEDSSIVLTTGGTSGLVSLDPADNNGIQIIDPDDAEVLTMTLTGVNGTISLSQSTGLTVQSAGGIEDVSTLVVTGSIADLNSALYGFVYSPVANFNGADEVTLETVRSSDYGSATALVTSSQINFLVTPVNDVPVANPDSLYVNEGSTNFLLSGGIASVLENDTDEEDGNNLMATIASQPINGVLTLQADGTFSYTHDGSETTSDSFSYTATDQDGAQSIPVTVTIIIFTSNDAPVAADDTVTVDESGTVLVEVLLNDTDAENDPLLVQLTQAPVNGVATINADNTITYVHDGSETTDDAFVYSIDDGKKVDTATVNITVVPVNDVPVANPDSLYVNEGSTNFLLSGGIASVLENDTDEEDGNNLMATIASQPINGVLTLQADGTFSYTHDGSETTSDSFSYTATDQDGAQSTPVTVPIIIFTSNDAPVAADDTVTVDESGTVLVEVLLNDTDAENDPLLVQLTQAPVNGVATINADNTITYVHDGSETTVDAFVYSIDDGKKVDTATVNIVVVPVNDVPIANPDSLYVNEGSTNFLLSGGIASVLENDTDEEDGNNLMATIASQPINGVLTLQADGTFSYTHDGSETTSDSFSYTATDQDGAQSIPVTVPIIIFPSNDRPVANPDSLYVNEGSTNFLLSGGIASVLENDTDEEDGNNLMATIASQPINGVLTLQADGTFSYTHDGSETTSDSFSYTATDQDGAQSTPVTVPIIIFTSNDAPVAADDTVTVDESGTVLVEVLLNDTDAENDPLLVQLTQAPVNGVATINADNTITYVHDGSETTVDAFVYSIDDGKKVDTATVNIVVSPVNDVPVAVADVAVVSEGGSVDVEVLLNDTDAEPGVLSPAIVNAPLHGSVTVNSDNSFSYQHDGSENFSDQFEYTVVDTSGAASNATVQMSVVPVNDQSPIFISASNSYQISENAAAGTLIGNIEAFDGDVDDLITVALSDDAGGRFQLMPGGDLVVLDGSLLNREIESEHVVVVTATDLAGNLSQQSIQIDLLDEVESISVLIAPDLFQVSEAAQNGASIGSVSAVPTDDSGQVTYALIDSADGRFSIDSVTGEIQVADASLLNYESDGIHDIIVEALDVTGAILSERYTISVVDVNEQPQFVSSVQAVAVSEAAVTGDSLLTLSATDPDGDDLLYAIESGNNSGAFSIDSMSGEISVNRAEFIDYEVQTQHVLTVSVTDAFGLTDVRSILVDVNNVDEPPELSSALSTVEFIENSAPVFIAPMAMISDVDSAQITSVEISIANYHEQEDRLLAVESSNIVSQFDEVTGLLTLAGPATIEEFNSALQQVQYVNSSENPNTGVRQLNVTIDGASNSVSSSLGTVQVVGVNDPLTGVPTFSGDAIVGGQLLADVSAMADRDGITQYHYQWMRDGQAIPGERGVTYVPVAADAGANLSLWVSVVDSTDRLEPWIESASTFILTPEPVPEPSLAAAEPLAVVDAPELIEIEFEPIEAESIASVLSSTDFMQQELTTEAVVNTNASNVVEQSSAVSALSSEAEAEVESEQIVVGDLAPNSVIGLPDVAAAISTDALLQVINLSVNTELNTQFINPLVSSELNTVSREITLERIEYEEQQVSLLSLDPLSLPVDEEHRVVWQVANVGLANSLTEISKNLKQVGQETRISGSTSEVLVGASFSVTAGFLIWMLRGGALLASVFSVSPLWKQLDPLPIVSANPNGDAGKNGDDEHVETLFDQKD